MCGYFDVQINGYAGVDFNAPDLTLADLRAACVQLKQDHVDGILLTLITDSIPALQQKISQIIDYCRQDSAVAEMIVGLHIEGPFISPVPGYVGAHPAAHACMTDLAGMDLLLEAGSGLIRMVTLAPEMDPGQRLIRALADQKIIVCAGHSDASLDQLKQSLDAGLTMFTHLGNGCPALMNRHDNIISRTLSLADQLWISFIADGAHIPFFALKNYLQLTGLSKVIIVTDAISAAGMPPGTYTIGERSVHVGEDGVPRCEEGNHFVGSGTTLARMARNLKVEVGLTDAEIDLVTKTNPRRVLARSHNLEPV